MSLNSHKTRPGTSFCWMLLYGHLGFMFRLPHVYTVLFCRPAFQALFELGVLSLTRVFGHSYDVWLSKVNVNARRTSATWA